MRKKAPVVNIKLKLTKQKIIIKIVYKNKLAREI